MSREPEEADDAVADAASVIRGGGRLWHRVPAPLRTAVGRALLVVLLSGTAGMGVLGVNRKISDTDEQARAAVADTLRLIVAQEVAPLKASVDTLQVSVNRMKDIMGESSDMRGAARRLDRRHAIAQADSLARVGMFRGTRGRLMERIP